MKLTDIVVGEQYEFKQYKSYPPECVEILAKHVPVVGYHQRGVSVKFLSGHNKGQTSSYPARTIIRTWGEAEEIRKSQEARIEQWRKKEADLRRHLEAVMTILERYEIEAHLWQGVRYRNHDPFGIVFYDPEQARKFRAVMIAKFGE